MRLLPDLPNTNPSIPNHSGQIPLLLAPECWDNGVFKILQGYEEVKANITEDNGRTPFAWASYSGIDQVVRLRRAGTM